MSNTNKETLTAPALGSTITGVLGEWERNGYNDSDFYAVYWDGKAVRTVQIDTTRYAGNAGYKLVKATDEEILAAREASVGTIAKTLLRDAKERIMRPQSVTKGDKLRLLKDVAWKDNKTGKVVTASKDSVVTVFWHQHYGTFYANGYNKPNRSNLRLGVKTEDGEVLFIGMTKCRLAEEIPTKEKIQEQAEYLSWEGKFADTSCAWMSYNWAATRLKAIKQDS